MNLHHLRFASSVARTGSFTAAAAECSVTQPALSNAVAQLEDELGQRLFVRTTRRVDLTPFGAQLLPDIQRVLDAQHDLVRRARAFLVPEQPMIRIGMSPLLDVRFLNVLLEPFRSGHPKTELVLREMNMADLDRLLEAGQIDFVFGVAGSTDKKRQRAHLYEEALMYVPRGGSKSAANGKGSVRFFDIAEDTFVMVPDACGLARTVRGIFRGHRRKLHEYSGEAMSYQVLEQWATLGVGAAIIPQSKLAGDHSRASRILDKKGEGLVLRFDATWCPDAEKASHLGAFSNYLKTVVPALSRGVAGRSRG